MALGVLAMLKGGSFAVDAGIMGGTALGYTVVSGMLLRKTQWSPASQMAVQGGAGVVGGLLVAPALPRMGMGLVVGGIVSAGQAGVRALAFSAAMRQVKESAAAGGSLPAGTTTSSTTTTTTTGAALGAGAAGQAPAGAVHQGTFDMAANVWR